MAFVNQTISFRKFCENKIKVAYHGVDLLTMTVQDDRGYDIATIYFDGLGVMAEVFGQALVLATQAEKSWLKEQKTKAELATAEGV